MKKLLVVGSQQINYTELFQGALVNNEPVTVEHCTWNDVSVCSYGDNGGLVVSISPSLRPLPGTAQDKRRVFHPDFVLLRAGCRGDARTDWRHMLSVIAHSNVPCINNVDSFVVSQDKAQLYGKLLRVKRRLGGFASFPLVPQGCYSDWGAATFPPDCPCVGKVGTASGGLGKMKINTVDEWDDFRSIMTMQPQYFATEPFINWTYDIRIQKIGNHYRAFRRTSKHWKSNVDITMKDEDIPVEERYKAWLDEAAAECGMDICAMDVLRVEPEGKEFILELNSSAIGLNGRHAKEDATFIRDLVLRRMEEALILKKGLPPKVIKEEEKKKKKIEKKEQLQNEDKEEKPQKDEKEDKDAKEGKEGEDKREKKGKGKKKKIVEELDEHPQLSYQTLLLKVKELEAELEQQIQARNNEKQQYLTQIQQLQEEKEKSGIKSFFKL
uniref:ATP-grasp domain-containing protein n=1 Tax=Arcella intermedia TaxID=1963864 RepID=A0A6B2L4A2_9EUKA